MVRCDLASDRGGDLAALDRAGALGVSEAVRHASKEAWRPWASSCDAVKHRGVTNRFPRDDQYPRKKQGSLVR